MIEVETGYLNEQELKDALEKQNKVYFNSSLRVFKDHYGLRPGELHLIVGPSGGGKSTFVKTTLFQALISGKGMLYLSEEPRDRYLLGLNKAFIEATKDGTKKDPSVFMNRLSVICELGMNSNTKKQIFSIIRDELLNTESTFLIFDNYTTSFLSRVGVQKEADIIDWFKNLAVELNIPVILVLHTEKGTNISKGAFSSENVRGNAMSGLMGSYVYVVMLIHGSTTRSFVLTDKARYHNDSNKSVYEMFFDKDLGLITKDMKSSSAELAKAIRESNEELNPRKRAVKNAW